MAAGEQGAVPARSRTLSRDAAMKGSVSSPRVSAVGKTVIDVRKTVARPIWMSTLKIAGDATRRAKNQKEAKPHALRPVVT